MSSVNKFVMLEAIAGQTVIYDSRILVLDLKGMIEERFDLKCLRRSLVRGVRDKIGNLDVRKDVDIGTLYRMDQCAIKCLDTWRG